MFNLFKVHLFLGHTVIPVSCGVLLGGTIQSPGGGGVFVADKLFISTRLGGALKLLNFITCLSCLYRTVLEVKYLFHAESARHFLFQKYYSPHPGD